VRMESFFLIRRCHCSSVNFGADVLALRRGLYEFKALILFMLQWVKETAENIEAREPTDMDDLPGQRAKHVKRTELLWEFRLQAFQYLSMRLDLLNYASMEHNNFGEARAMVQIIFSKLREPGGNDLI
jgi:hypothetical protein